MASAWLNTATRLVLLRRARARDLALAYYRLVRALRTGRTIPDPRDPEPTSVSLEELRVQFRALAEPESLAEEPSEAAPPNDTTPPPEGGSGDAGRDDGPSEDAEAERILIEELEGLREEEQRIERAAEEEARVALEALGPASEARLIDQIDNGQPASEVDELRGEAHNKAGARQASAAARVAMDGARSSVWTYTSRDKRAIGYVRVSRTGTPCGWCAMLISRGPVYKSEKSATLSGGAAAYEDGDKYHDNCNCYAMPVFSREQFNDSDLFALNRLYAEQWPRVTRGLSGKAALSAWRRFIKTEQAASRRRGSTTSVQEA